MINKIFNSPFSNIKLRHRARPFEIVRQVSAFMLICSISACASLDFRGKQTEPSETLETQAERETAKTKDSVESDKLKKEEAEKANIPKETPTPISSQTQKSSEKKPEKPKQVIQNQTESVETPTTIVPTGVLYGKVSLLDAKGESVSPKGTLLELIPENDVNKAGSVKAQSRVVDTQSKTYIPGFMTVNVGDTLVFTNSDPIKHNVFSSSKNNTFDLGTYGYNRIEKYQVQNEGIIKVYCNIHREMALFISASRGNPSYVAGDEGEFEFKSIAAGSYTLKAWHPRGESLIPVKIRNGKIRKDVLIDTSNYTPEPRVNKHGKPYKKKPAIFEDEFY